MSCHTLLHLGPLFAKFWAPQRGYTVLYFILNMLHTCNLSSAKYVTLGRKKRSAINNFPSPYPTAVPPVVVIVGNQPPIGHCSQAPGILVEELALLGPASPVK